MGGPLFSQLKSPHAAGCHFWALSGPRAMNSDSTSSPVRVKPCEPKSATTKGVVTRATSIEQAGAGQGQRPLTHSVEEDADKKRLYAGIKIKLYLMDWADEATLTAHIAKLQQHGAAKC